MYTVKEEIRIRSALYQDLFLKYIIKYLCIGLNTNTMYIFDQVDLQLLYKDLMLKTEQWAQSNL